MKFRSLIILCAALLVASFPAHAAADYFLKLDDIDGESTDEKHKGEIEILSFSFGATQSGTNVGGGGGGAGKVSFSDISFTKSLDKSSPMLYLQCAQGKHIPRAILSCRKSGGTDDYYVITLHDVLISSVQTSGGSGGERPTESLSLNYTKIEFSYSPQKADGSLDTPVRTGWDIELNTEIRPQ